MTFKAVNNLKLCSERLRTDLVSNECSMYNSAEPITIAENELIGVANSIEEASTKLAKLRHCQIHVYIFFYLKKINKIFDLFFYFISILFIFF